MSGPIAATSATWTIVVACGSMAPLYAVISPMQGQQWPTDAPGGHFGTCVVCLNDTVLQSVLMRQIIDSARPDQFFGMYCKPVGCHPR